MHRATIIRCGAQRSVAPPLRVVRHCRWLPTRTIASVRKARAAAVFLPRAVIGDRQPSLSLLTTPALLCYSFFPPSIAMIRTVLIARAEKRIAGRTSHKNTRSGCRLRMTA
jgi:hypothetical protein